jgi:5,10-methylenetetrahydromethanopterin reductase
MFPMAAFGHTGDMSVQDWVAYARRAAELGYRGLWVAEESGKEAFTVLAVVGLQVPVIELGVGITSVYARTPMLLAMESQTLEQVVGPRFVLGLGTGGLGFVERGHGVKMERPIARVRETVQLVRGYLSGQRLTHDGQFFSPRSFSLREKPLRTDLPVWLSALNPQMLRLAGEVADGVLLNWLTPKFVEEVVRPQLRAGAERSGRDPAALQIATLTPTCCDPADPDARLALRRMIGFYCAAPPYHFLIGHEDPAFLDRAREIIAAWERDGPDRAVELVPDEMIDAFSLTGQPDQTRRRLEAFQALGVYPLIYPIPRRERVYEDTTRAIELAASLAP